MIVFSRGLEKLYDPVLHKDHIYFATDTGVIIHNGKFSWGDIPSQLERIQKSVDLNAAELAVLTGTGVGSIKYQINEAINEFATTITDNGVVDTFKELVDFAAEHKSEIGDLIITVDKLEERCDGHDAAIAGLRTEIQTTKEGFQLEIDGLETSIPQTIDNKINQALSWEEVEVTI